MGPAPPGLQGVCDAAKEGKAPGKITLSLGVALPGGLPVVAASGSMQQAAGGVVFEQSRVRLWVPRAQAKAIKVSRSGHVGSNGKAC